MYKAPGDEAVTCSLQLEQYHSSFSVQNVLSVSYECMWTAGFGVGM